MDIISSWISGLNSLGCLEIAGIKEVLMGSSHKRVSEWFSDFSKPKEFKEAKAGIKLLFYAGPSWKLWYQGVA